MFSMGNITVLGINDPNLVKEMDICTSWDLAKSSFFKKVIDPLLGKGVINSDGLSHARQRKIVAPELYSDKVKV